MTQNKKNALWPAGLEDLAHLFAEKGITHLRITQNSRDDWRASFEIQPRGQPAYHCHTRICPSFLRAMLEVLEGPRFFHRGEPLTILDIDATTLFDDENINWRYCKAHATFVHMDEDVCEFIVHLGDDANDPDYFTAKLREMQTYGCTAAFLEACQKAKELGAVRVLFYA